MEKSKTPKIYIGTSGWTYNSWLKKFYPENLPKTQRLDYYSKHFKTVEINYSFWRQPRAEDYQKWHKTVPDDFVFSSKAPRFITHIKRLKNVEFFWEVFIKREKELKEKLGPILFQFPENFTANVTNLKRLEEFMKMITVDRTLKCAFEFRSCSFFNETMYEFLRGYKIALVYADSPDYPRHEAITSDFMYVRMHGSKELFISRYAKRELERLAEMIKSWLKKNLSVYVYFNNDADANAPANAKELLEILKI